MKPIKYFLVVSLFLFVQLLRNESFSQSDEARFNAVTIEDENLFPETATSIQNLVDYTGKPITTRIVLHPDKADIYNPTQSDILAASNLHPISRTMGEILDSYYWAWPSWEPCIQNITRKSYPLLNLSITREDYLQRLTNFLNSDISDNIDIYEIGNEINAPWVYNGNIDLVKQTMADAIVLVKAYGKKVALTLYHYPMVSNYPWYACVDHCPPYVNPFYDIDYMMIEWARNFCATYPEIAVKVDYVFVSYYAESHTWCKPEPTNWDAQFGMLDALFLNALVGFGECGYPGTKEIPIIEQRMDEFYVTGLLNENPDYFCKGNFWWFYSNQCVGNDPVNQELWTHLANDIRVGFRPYSNVTQGSDIHSLSNYPNPFNPSTQIMFSVERKSFVKLVVYNTMGQEVSRLIDNDLTAGNHQVEFNGSNLASGIYFYSLYVDGFKTSTKKMLLIK